MRFSTTAVARLAVRHRWTLLVAAVALGVAAYVPARGLKFDRTIESLFADSDPALQRFLRLRETFGGNEVVLVVYDDPDVLAADGSGLRRQAAVGERLRDILGVKAVLTLDRVLELPSLSATGEKLYFPPQQGIGRGLAGVFARYTHSPDGATGAAVVMLTPTNESPVSRDETLDQIFEATRDLPGKELAAATLAGEPTLIRDAYDALERDGRRLQWLTSALLAATLLVFFRDVRWVALALAVVQVSVLWTKGLLVAAGLELTLVSSVLPAVITVVGVATVTHVAVRYRAYRDRGAAAEEAFVAAASWLSWPILWACVTDAVGFAALMAADVRPVAEFGLMLAVGALMVPLATLLLAPAVALLGHKAATAGCEKLRDHNAATTSDPSERLLSVILRRPRAVAATTLLAATAVSLGGYRMRIQSEFIRNFRESSDVVQGYDHVESRLGGAGVWDVVVPAPEELTRDYLQRVRALEERLINEAGRAGGGAFPAEGEPGERETDAPPISKALSLADPLLVSAAGPLGIAAPVSVPLWQMRSRIPAFVDALYAENPTRPGQKQFRIMLRSDERQDAPTKRRIIEDVRRIAAEEVAKWPEHEAATAGRGEANTNRLAATPQAGGAEPSNEIYVTGLYVLLTRIVESVLRDQWLTFGLALALVGVTMMIALKSAWLGLAAIVPNALAVAALFGALGWLDVEVNLGVAMIAAVSLGLGVDASLHYLTAYRRARREGSDAPQAVLAAHHSAGRAITFATLALAVGFAAMMASDFLPTAWFGALTGLAMLAGWFGNLVILPAILLAVRPQG